jgi:hypothetical protein
MSRLGYGYPAILFATAADPSDITLLTPEKAKEIGIAVNVEQPPTVAAPPPIATAPLPAPQQPVVAMAPVAGPDTWRAEALRDGTREAACLDSAHGDYHRAPDL